MNLEELLNNYRSEILKIAEFHGAYNVRVFGSVARGEARVDSDVDFLVELEQNRTLIDQIALIQDLQGLLGCKVDVAEPESLHEIIREKVLDEAVPL